MKYFPKNQTLILLLALGAITRLLLALLPGFQIDMGDWFAWSVRLSHLNFTGFYSKDVFTDYTPGYLYILSLLGFLKEALKIQDSLFYILLKIPAIISDLIISLLIYKLFIKSSKRQALLSLILVLFNPISIFNSSIWGQIDSILTLLLLITVIALKKDNLITSSIFYGLAVLTKPQALALAPLFIVFLIKNFKLPYLLKIFIPASLVIFLLSFPFFPNHTLINLFQHNINTANEYPYTSLNAYNLWGVVGFWILDSQTWIGFSYQTIGIILFLIYSLIILSLFLKKRLSLYSLAALLLLGFYFLPTRVHERYLYPAIIFLIFITMMFRSRFLLLLTGLLGLLHFLNLYYVYVYYNEFYFKLPKIFYIPLIYEPLVANSKGLSMISTIVFIFISIGIIRSDATSKKPQR